VGDYYLALAENLRNRFAIISDPLLKADPATQLEQLKTNSRDFDDLKRQLPADAPPMLAHYLQRLSLVKALEFLDAHLASSAEG
jgi:hypothetical protein